MSKLDATLTRVTLNLTFDLYLSLWIFKVKLYLGNGRTYCHGRKGTRVDRMPWCETLRKWVNCMLRWLGYLWSWIFKVKLYLGNGRPDCHETKGTGVDRMPWCETLRQWFNWMLCWLGYLWPWSLTLNFQGQLVSQKWEARLSKNERGRELIGCSDVKHNHYVISRQRILLETGVT